MEISVLQQFEKSVEQAVDWLGFQLHDEGTLDNAAYDLRNYAALPYLFAHRGRLELAHRNLGYIQKDFLRDAQILNSSLVWESETICPKDDWTASIGWIALAAQTMGRFELALPVLHYVRQFYMPEQGAFTARAPFGQAEAVIDFGATALLGWVSLYCGDMVKAQRAGNFLQCCISMQSDIRSAFYLRMDDAGRLITSFDNSEAQHYVVLGGREEQKTQELGLAVGVMGKLYAATNEMSYLTFAKSCQESLQGFSEKTGADATSVWGAAVLARITKEARYIEQAQQLANELLMSQAPHGAWEDGALPFVTTIQNAIWLSHAAAELSGV